MRKQKWTALITALCMLFCMGASFALPANAEAVKQEIYTAEEFLAIAAGDLGGNYIQKADIDLKGVGYAPIGTVDQPFTGTYDGNGYTISGLYLESDQSFQGLFGVNNGTIRNVTLTEDCFISGSSHVGAIAGRNNGTIEGCLSYAAVSHSAISKANNNTYTMLSQNLCQWGDNYFWANDPNYVDSTSNSRRPGMMIRINDADPDIIFFQEVSFRDKTSSSTGKKITAWSTYLQSQLGSEYTIIGEQRSNSDAEGVMVAFRTSKFREIKRGLFWLSKNPDGPKSIQTHATYDSSGVLVSEINSNSWDSACVRTAQWVVLEDKTTGQQIITCSTHTDHKGAKAKDEGTKLIAERMAALQKDFPNALLAVGGDFNTKPGTTGYVNMENAINGMMDDSRYVAEERLNNIGTTAIVSETKVEGSDELKYVGSELETIDYIFVNSATTEVSTFEVKNEHPFDLFPSDHHGVVSTIRAQENNFVGGICGSNDGTVRSILAEGSVNSGDAHGCSTVLGNNLYMAATRMLYAKNAAVDKVIGRPVTLNTLSENPNLKVVSDLNEEEGCFEIEDGRYRIIKECGEKRLVECVVNGIVLRLPVGSVYEPDLEIPEGALVLLNGKPYDGKAVVVPAEGFQIVVATPAINVTSAVSSGDYTVSSEAEWMHVYNYLSRFKSRNVTIHLQNNIDLSLSATKNFKGFTNPAFSFDGHGYTISNFGSGTSAGGVGLFRVSTGAGGMKFIKDVTLENCHVSGSNTAVLYSVAHDNSGIEGLPTALSITGITLDNCSASVASQACSLLLSRYGVKGESATITIRDCRIKNSRLDTKGSAHMGLIVGKPREAGKTTTYNISDCYLANNEMVNVKDGAGFVCGTAELSTNVNISNVGIFGNRASGASGSEFHYLCGDNVCSGVISADKLMIAGNTVSATSVYMISGVSGSSASEVPTNYYSDATITAVSEGVSATYSQTELYAFQLGVVGYLQNQELENPAFYWAKDDSNYYRPATAEGRIGAVVNDGDELFINGGTQYNLGTPSQGKWMVVEGESTLQGNILTVAGDLTTVSQVQRVSQVTSTVTDGDYTIEDITDWMALYNNISRFQNRSVTIHLLCDIDLSVAEAAGFKGFANPAFSFDGHNHTIKNWGTKTARKAYQALFYATEGAGGMNYIKNLKVSNCHVGAASGFGAGAIVFSSTNENGGFEGLATEFTLENIHIQGCSLQSPGESSGMLLSRYGVTGSGFDVHIKNCSVVGCELDAGGSAHKGMLVGKPRSTDAGTANFNITDCYVADNTIINAVNGAGALFGTAESSSTVMNITNVAAVNNIVTAASGYTEGAYLGYSDRGTVNLERVIINGNTVNAEDKYLIATNVEENQKLNLGTVYSDITDLTAVLEESNTNPTLAPQAALIASGEAAYLMNEQCTGVMYWWTESGKVKGGDQDHRATKLFFTLADGTMLKTTYANGCGAADLSMNEDPDATFATYGNGAVSGNTLQVPAGATEVYVVVTPGEDSPFDPTYIMPVSKVSSPVTMGTYSVSNIDEWMYLFDHGDYFANENITIVLTADLDFSDSKALRFTGFIGAQFSLNGEEHTLKNWNHTTAETAYYRGGLFMEYLGKSIKNLTIEGFNVAGTYGRSILVAGYNGTGNLTIENVHVEKSTLDTSAAGGHMGVFLSRATTAAASGAAITLRNCSVIDTDLQNSAGGRINNSGLLIGTAYQGFNYTIENCMIQDCKVNTDTGAGGFVVGAVEGSSSKMRMNRVAIYDCSGRVAPSNDCPGVFIGEMSQGANATVTNCMAANLSIEGGKSLSFLRHSDQYGAATVSVSNCLTDFAPVEIIPTDNSAGTTGTNKGAIAGAAQISSAAFKSGEAAWRSTKGATANRWWVDDSFNQYPAFYREEGYGVPYQVTFGADAFYTNGSGKLPASAEPYLTDDDGLWKNGEEQVTAATVFTADATLTLEGHSFLPQDAVPDGEGFHKIPCSDPGCSEEKRVACSFTEGITQSAKEGVHYQSCICGNRTELSCSYDVVSGQDGAHYEKCKECGKQTAAAPCSFTYTTLEDGRHTKKCSVCQYSAEEKCTYKLVSRGDGYHYEKCNHCGAQKEAVACTLSYVAKDHDLHAQKCSVCSYETEAAACDYKASSLAGTNTHVKQCKVCSRIKLTEPCKYAFVSGKDGTHYEKCSDCGDAKQAAACSFSYTQKEGDLHTKECKDCHYTVDEACAYLFVDRGDGYHYEKCASCGKQKEAVACTYGNFVHVAGNDTHQETCFDCGHAVADAKCVLRAEADTLPAIGESFCGAYACVDACGNRRENQWMRAGDLNNDGKVNLVDVILILQVLSEMRPLDSVQSALGNVCVTDGYTANGGLNVNDAVMILRYLLKK